MKAMASWVMSRMISGLVAVLACAGFGESVTGGNPMKSKEGRIMDGKMVLWLFGCAVCLGFAFVAAGGFATEGVTLWVMAGLIGVPALGGVLIRAGFGKPVTEGISLRQREEKVMKKKGKLVFASVVLMAMWGMLVMGAQSVIAQSTPSVIYATSAKDIRIVPLVQGDIPDLDNGTDLTASATCQTNLISPANIYSLNSTGDFLAVWWNRDEDTACYSRFTPDGKGSFTEDYKGEWHGGATSVWQSYVANMWSPLPPVDLNADQKDDLVLVRWFGSSGSSSTSKTAEYKVALGKEDGSFDFNGTPATFITGAWTGSAILDDADGDGYADLVYYSFRHGGSQSTDFYMLKGKGDGTFSDAADKKLLISTESSQSSSSAVIADFNSDGHPDIFLSPDDDISDEGQAYIAFGQGGGTFGPIQESIDFVPSDEGWSSDTFSASAQVYDVNMDGHIDIVANESTWDVRTVKSVWWGDGNGQFSTTGEILYSAPSGTPYAKTDWLSVPSSHFEAVEITATITADNYFALYVGDENGVTFIGSGDDWSQPQTFTFDADPKDYLYVAAWSDGRVAQGMLGEFVSDSDIIVTNTSDWKVYLTNHDLDGGDPAPLSSDIEADIASAAWEPIANSLDYGSSPWGSPTGISEDAQWIWGSDLIGGSDYGEYQLFRTQVKSSVDCSYPGACYEFKAGVFTVNETGLVKADWLYDGGAYKGELGIFSTEGMDMTVPDLTAFVAEAVTRVLSGTDVSP